MIEREAQVPKDRRLISAVIYNRLQRGIPLGIDATLRYRLNNWSKALQRVRAEHRLRLQHAPAHRPAAHADRQPGAGLDPGRGRPGQRQVPLLRGQAVRQRRPRVQLDRRAVPEGRRRLQPRPRQARRQGSLALLSSDVGSARDRDPRRGAGHPRERRARAPGDEQRRRQRAGQLRVGRRWRAPTSSSPRWARGASSTTSAATRGWRSRSRAPQTSGIGLKEYLVVHGQRAHRRGGRARAAAAPGPHLPRARREVPADGRPASRRRRAHRRGPPGRRRPLGLTRLGVLGWPVAHSRSPAMHNAALRAVGLTDWRYQRLPVAAGALRSRRCAPCRVSGFAGANVTIPHKEAALALADEATATPPAPSARPTR